MKPYGAYVKKDVLADITAPDKADALAWGSPSRVMKMSSKKRRAGRRALHKTARRAAKNDLKRGDV